MPPSGYNKKAINAILEITKIKYESIFDKFKKSNMDEATFLGATISQLEKEINNENLEPSISRNIKIFMIENYKDLVKEIYAGHDKHNRSVINGGAIQKEINQINSYLNEVKI